MALQFKNCIRFILFSVVVTSDRAWAIDTVPGSAIAPPPGLNAFMLSLVDFKFGNKYLNDQVAVPPGPGAKIDSQLALLRYTRTFSLNDQPAAFYIQPSLARAKPGGVLSAQNKDSGMGDTAAAFAYWFLADRAQGEYFGIGNFLVMPTGEYDSGQLINVGSNRYTFAQNLVYQNRLHDSLDYMVGLGYEWYSDNDDYRLTHQKYAQDTLFTTQWTLMHNIDDSLMVAASYFHDWGAAESFNGSSLDNDLKRDRWGLALVKKTKAGKFTVQYGKHSDTNNGLLKEQELFLRWQVAWK